MNKVPMSDRANRPLLAIGALFCSRFPRMGQGILTALQSLHE